MNFFGVIDAVGDNVNRDRMKENGYPSIGDPVRALLPLFGR